MYCTSAPVALGAPTLTAKSGTLVPERSLCHVVGPPGALRVPRNTTPKSPLPASS